MKVRVTVFDGEQHDGDWPCRTEDYSPAKLKNVIAWFQSKLDLIPREFRNAATCRVDSAGGYEGEHYGHIEIHYIRPATAEERATHKAEELEQQRQKREKEVAALRALRDKYPEEL